jgi:hypothetical protein
MTAVILAVVTTALLAASSLRVAEAAPRPPAVETAGALPCTRDELVEALALRVDAASVRVEVAGERVRIRIGERSRDLLLDGARGRAAARLIALAAADLAMAELPTPAPPAPVIATAPPPPRRTIELALTGRVGSSAALRGALAVDAAFGRPPWRPVIAAGAAGGVGDHDVSLIGAPLRAGVAWGDELQVRATALAIPYAVRGGDGDASVLGGGGLEGRAHTRAGDTTLLFAAGVDVLANRARYLVAGAPALSTPRVTAWTVLGVTWEVAP